MASTIRRPTARVYVNGSRFQLPDTSGAISLGWAVGQPIAGGSIRVMNVPFEPAIKMPVVVEWGFDWNHVYGFHGFVVNPQRAAYPKYWNLAVQDILWLADFPVQKEPINLLNNMTANEAMRRLLHDYSGIPLSRIEIPDLEQSPGVPWLLGTMTPILFNGSPLQGCIQICDALGYQLYADEGGVVRARKMTGAPSDGPVAYFDQGRDWLVSGAPVVNSDGSTIYTRVIVTGAMTNIITGPSGEQRAVAVTDAWQVDNHPYLPSGKHRELSYTNTLVEFVDESEGGDASCTAIAKRMILEHSRTPFAISGRLKADPRLGIGMTVAARSSRIGLDNYRSFTITSIQRNFGGGNFEQQLTLDGGVGEAGRTLIPPPVAAFLWTLHQETLLGQDYIEVFLDGTPSKGYGTPETTDAEGNIIEPPPGTDPLNTIQSWLWYDENEPPNAANGKRAMFKYPATQQTARICLTVTDVTAKEATFCTVVNLAGDVGSVPAKRELSFAAGASWYVTPDGGKNWRRENLQYTEATPPISSMGSIAADQSVATALGFLSAGNDDGGGVRATVDYLATASHELNAGGANPITFMWQHEKNPERIWLAIGNQVFRSIDSGQLFFPVGTFEAPVKWVVESIDTLGVVDVISGSNLYTSWDAQTDVPHWTPTLTGPADSVARNYVSGFERHWVGFETVAAGSSPLRSVEGDIAAFPVVVPPVEGIRGLTMMVDRPLLVAIDQAGRVWTLDSTGGSAFHAATLPD